MGSSHYSSDTYHSRMTEAAETGTDVFKHTEAIRQGRTASGVHEKLNPANLNKVGRNIRESLDSTPHPASNAVAVMFDVTGSMSGVPRTFIAKLGQLMDLLTGKAYLPDPQILFGAVGDAKSDNAPLQVGQFESGNEMDEALSLAFLEGGGGAGIHESYELALYYLTRHAEMDCFDKRGKKGYLFLMGDELPYPKVSKREVERVIGDNIEADIPLEDMLTEARKKFEVFWILPGGTNHWEDPAVVDELSKLFGQNLIKLKNPDDICECIASIIGVAEGHDIHDVATALGGVGANAASIKRVTTALAGHRRFDLHG